MVFLVFKKIHPILKIFLDVLIYSDTKYIYVCVCVRERERERDAEREMYSDTMYIIFTQALRSGRI